MSAQSASFQKDGSGFVTKTMFLLLKM